MTKARDLANLISQGNPLADGGIAFSEVTGTPTTVAGYGITDSFDGAYGSLTGSPTLGTAAALDVGTGANNIPQLDSNGNLPCPRWFCNLLEYQGFHMQQVSLSAMIIKEIKHG